MASPYMDSASKQIDEGKKALLESVAQAGTQGKAAFDQAQQQAAAARQEALTRAAQQRTLYGVGGNDQTFLGAYDARANQMGVNRTNFESGLAQTQASGESYLEKARASIPLLESQNMQKVTDQETKIKLAIEAARAKAEEARLKEERALQRQLDAEARAEARALAREGRAAARSAAKPPKAADLFSAGELAKQQLVGGAQGQVDKLATPIPAGAFGKISNEPGGSGKYIYNSGNLALPIARQTLKEAGALNVEDLARQIGLNLGLDPVEVGAILNPAAVNSYRSAVAKLAPPDPQAATVKQLATKTGRSEADVRGAMGDLRYKRDYADIAKLLSEGVTWDQVDAGLRAKGRPQYTPTTYAILQAQWRPLFSNAGLLKATEE